MFIKAENRCDMLKYYLINVIGITIGIINFKKIN